MNTPASTKVEQLLPCPFCGGEAKQYPIRGIMGFTISCQSCGASAYESDPQRVALHWNRRATLTPAPSGEGREASGILEALDQALEQFSEPMSALNPHELGERLANDVAEIVRHARARSALLAPHKDTSHD